MDASYATPPGLGLNRGRRPRKYVQLISLAIPALGLLPGCRGVDREWLQQPARYRHGVVFVLPGIEGESRWNRRLARGLDAGGIPAAIEIYDWTTKIPGNFLGNLTDLERNRLQARRLAERIVDLRREHPRVPVYLIGHSGGAGIAIMAIEALPTGHTIDMAILLAPAVSPEYELSTVLVRSRLGVLNFYSDEDVTFLRVGTSVFGAIDRYRGPSAGAVGFRTPEDLLPTERELYERKLRQVVWTERLKRFDVDGSHIGWTEPKFAREYLAPIILRGLAARYGGKPDL